jgi:hypothetical protein
MNFNDLRRVEYSYDGTQIKVYYYNGLWRLATTRSINAFRSKWIGAKSFGEMFEEAVDQYPGFMERLNPQHVYSFVLLHPENKLVVKYDRPQLIHVLTRDSSDQWREIDVDIGVNKPECVRYETEEALIRDIRERWNGPSVGIESGEKVNISYEGVILVDSEGNRMKILYEKYQKLNNLRGNMRKIDYRLMEMRNNPGERMEFVYHYDLFSEFNDYEDRYNRMVKAVHQNYCRRYIRHEVQALTELPAYMRTIVYRIHQNYRENKTDIMNSNSGSMVVPPMTVNRIHELFGTFPTPLLYFVYKRV